MEDMHELMLHFLQDIYYAEKVGLRSMAKMVKAAENEELKAAIEEHRTQSQGQIERLAGVFAELGKKPRGKTCAAMDGIVQEGNEAIAQGEKGAILDAALIACEQAAEHYEIARYGAMASWADALELEESAGILRGILKEEKDADLKLSEISERMLKPQAAQEVAKPDPEPASAKRAPARRSTRAGAPEPEPVKKVPSRKSPRARTPARAAR